MRGVTGVPPTDARTLPAWVSPSAWTGILYGERNIPYLAGLAEDVILHSKEWETWVASAEPHLEPLPSGGLGSGDRGLGARRGRCVRRLKQGTGRSGLCAEVVWDAPVLPAAINLVL